MLYSSDRCKNVFANLPLAYRRFKNISDILFRAKLPEPTNTDNLRPGSKAVTGNSRAAKGSFVQPTS